MKVIQVKVNTKSKRKLIEKISEAEYKAFFSQPREKGKANSKLLEMLAEYFSISKKLIKFISGQRSTVKIIQIG